MFKKSALIILSVLVVTVSIFATACSKNNTADNTVSTTENQSATAENADATTESNPEIAVDTTEISETSVETTQAISLATTEEIVAYFNECANKIKTDATKAVKNFEKRKVGELKVPDILQSSAESLIGTLMKDDTEPIVYATKDEIKENYPVPAQSYVSCLTADDVVKATCIDKGDTYEIYFRLKDEKNPASGMGVGSVCDVIEAHDINESAPSFVKELSTYYSNCEVTATIDKSTGRVIHAVYSTPVRLNVVVDMFGTHNVVANFTFIKDYTVTY